MPANPLSQPLSAAASHGTGTTRRRTAVERIDHLVQTAGLTSAQLQAILARARIRELMREHDISLDDLRGGEPSPPASGTELQQGTVPITHCPSKGVDRRFQLCGDAHGEGSFMADWRQRRGVAS